jgi:hypothetical protein
MKTRKYLPMTASNEEITQAYNAGYVVIFTASGLPPCKRPHETAKGACQCHDCVQFGFSKHPTAGGAQ